MCTVPKARRSYERKGLYQFEAALFILGGVLQHKIVLKPGDVKVLHLVFGISESLDEARTVSAKFSDPCVIEQELKRAEEYYLDKYSSLTVKTPDEKINHIMNNWVKKQVDFCIVGKKGVRRQSADLCGIVKLQAGRCKAGNTGMSAPSV